MRTRNLTVAPGAYDALSARLIEAGGFPAVYMSGGGATCSLIGQPDLGLLGLAEMSGQASRLAAAVSVPVIADGDTGFGNALNVIRSVEQYERAGVAGVHLEDQVFPKRCGHLPGKEVVATEEFEMRVRAAVHARSDPDFVIIARTDARAVHGLHEVADRAYRFASAGADVVFAEGLQTVEEVATVSHAAGVPLLVNQVPGGQAPVLPHDELRQAGCLIVIYPSLALSSAVTAVEAALAGLAAGGAAADQSLSPAEIFERVGLQHWQETSEQFAVEGASSQPEPDTASAHLRR